MNNRSNLPGQEKRKFLDITEATCMEKDIYTMMIDLFKVAVRESTGSITTRVISFDKGQ